MTENVSFEVPRDINVSILAIAQRAQKLWKKNGQKLDVLSTTMDLCALYAQGMKLNFDKLMGFPDFDFAHDISGIARHINRRTGKLENCFWPRCGVVEEVSHEDARNEA